MRRLVTASGGFTITELLMAVTITLFFAMSFYAAFFGMRNQLAQQNFYFNSDRATRFALERISKDVKEAVSVVTSWGGSTTGDAVLVLKLPSLNASSEPTNISTQFDYVTYKLDSSDSTKLVRSLDILDGTSQREGGADQTNKLIGKSVQSVLFSYNGTGLSSVSSSTIPTLKYLNVQISAQGTAVGLTQTTQLDSDVMLRNQLS